MEDEIYDNSYGVGCSPGQIALEQSVLGQSKMPPFMHAHITQPGATQLTAQRSTIIIILIYRTAKKKIINECATIVALAI